MEVRVLLALALASALLEAKEGDARGEGTWSKSTSELCATGREDEPTRCTLEVI